MPFKNKLIILTAVALFMFAGCAGTADLSEGLTENESGGSQSDTEPVEKNTILLDEDVIYDKILGSWAGQAIGVVWGAPTEFIYQARTIPDKQVPPIESLKLDDAAGQDDLYVELPFLDAMDEYGVNCSLDQLAEEFKNSEFGLAHANLAARNNLKNGIGAPLSGSYQYNFHCDDIDWQIESDFVGQLYPGLVSEAAVRAFEIGHIMNYGDGVYGGVFVSAMHSAAFNAESVNEIISAGISAIPEDTSFRSLLDDVVKWHDEGKSWEECWQELENKWGSTDRCVEFGPGTANIDAKLNSGYVLIGLLYGDGDFDNSIKIAMQCGQDSDCNPSSVGAILGNFYGYEKLSSVWKDKINLTGYKFAYTDHTLKSAVDLNFKLALDMLDLMGFKKDGKVWTVLTDKSIVPVAYEQWPDMPSVAANAALLTDNILKTTLLAYDPNGIKSVIWDYGDGITSADGNTVHVYKDKGEYKISCIVTNNNGNDYIYSDTVTVTAVAVNTDPDKGTVRNISGSGVAICSDSMPTGSGSKDLSIICDGVKRGANADQYDTFIGVMGAHEDYVGYIFIGDYKVSSVKFTEGMHFDNGGWFADGSLKLQALVDGKWEEVDASMSPTYPNANKMSAFGAAFQTYTFTFDERICAGIRLIGTAGGEAGFISVAELEITGVEAE